MTRASRSETLFQLAARAWNAFAATRRTDRSGNRTLFQLTERAWSAFDRARELRLHVVEPAAPILFFGDLDAYRKSPLRALTVGLNPSLREFPAGEPFRRFPLAAGDAGRRPSRYLDAMSAYFRTDPYSGWFNAFERLLEGMGASYYPGGASTALHTDICSPVATDPTWSKLGASDQKPLEADGGPLWHDLLAELRPQIVALSVAKKHLERIEFTPMDEWKTIRVFMKTGPGDCWCQPYEVRARWYDVGGEWSLFVFGRATQTPFGTLSSALKREAGETALKEYRNGR